MTVDYPANFPHEAVNRLQKRLEPYTKKLDTHPLYKAVQNIDDLRRFMESHVYAVWDFMSLLKYLQRELTCIKVPWNAKGPRTARRLINEIVLGEECDFVGGQHISHLELYIESMEAAGAKSDRVQKVLSEVDKMTDISDASLQKALQDAPAPAADFVRSTFDFIRTGKLHIVAAAFAFGREDLIPLMFTGMLRDMNKGMEGALDKFIVYLERHIEVDGDDHGPMSMIMMSEICGDSDDPKWEEATVAAEQALQARINLWDGVVKLLDEQRGSKKL